MDWFTLETFRAVWAPAPDDDTLLQPILDTAKADVLTFDAGYLWTGDGDFPGDYPGGEVPAALVMAQRMQAVNLVNINRVAPMPPDDAGDVQVTPFPLDWVTRQVARPKRRTS